MNVERPDASGEGRMAAAILFADIRDFTPLTHRLRTGDVRYNNAPPDLEKRGEVVTITELLKAYFPPICSCIYEESGVVDKFIGDSIMAFFQEEIAGEGGLMPAAVRSVRAALAMQECFQREILPQWEREWLDAFRKGHNEALSPRLGIGIAYGEAEFAYFPGKAEGVVYTPVGETVNLAARLESIAGKYYEFETGKQELASIVVSGTVLDQVKEDFRCEKYEPTFVRGIQFPQRIGGVLGPKRRRKSGSASASEV